SAVTLIGTLCRLSLRRSAVTTMSSRAPAESPAASAAVPTAGTAKETAATAANAEPATLCTNGISRNVCPSEECHRKFITSKYFDGPTKFDRHCRLRPSCRIFETRDARRDTNVDVP